MLIGDPGVADVEPAARPSHQTLLPSSMCVDALIEAAGNTHSAAERLGITPQTLIASIAQDPAAEATLTAQLRMLTTLHTFDTFRAAKMLIDSAMVDMDPKDLARFFSDLARQISESTDNKTVNHNVNVADFVMRSLPPDAREAMMALVPSLTQSVPSRRPRVSGPGSDPHSEPDSDAEPDPYLEPDVDDAA